MPKIFYEQDFQSIVNEIKSGKALIAFTDTVIGIFSLDQNQIFKIKNRPTNKKISLMINKYNVLPPVKKCIKKILLKFWPGDLTVIIDGFSYRMPNNEFLLRLIEFTGSLYSSSANLSGDDQCNSIEEAQKVFSCYDNELIYVNNVKPFFEPSVVVDVSNKKILRENSNTFMVNYIKKKLK